MPELGSKAAGAPPAPHVPPPALPPRPWDRAVPGTGEAAAAAPLHRSPNLPRSHSCWTGAQAESRKGFLLRICHCKSEKWLLSSARGRGSAANGLRRGVRAPRHGQQGRGRTAGSGSPQLRGPGSRPRRTGCPSRRLGPRSFPCLPPPRPLTPHQEARLRGPLFPAIQEPRALEADGTAQAQGEEGGGTYSPSRTPSRGHPARHQERSRHPQSPPGPPASQSSHCASAGPEGGRGGHRAEHLRPGARTCPDGPQTHSEAK